MDTLQHLAEGFGVALMPINLLVATIGAFIGTIVGMLPGLGPINGVALLMPLAFALKLPPETALILLTAVYIGCEFGGRISSILLNVPGDAGAIMTAIDGHPMAVKGQGGGVVHFRLEFVHRLHLCHHGYCAVCTAAGALGPGVWAGRIFCTDVFCFCLHHRVDG